MRSTYILFWCLFFGVSLSLSNSAEFDYGGIEWHHSCDANYPALNKIYGVSKEQKTWEEAKQLCRSVADGLATFRNESEAEAFKDIWGKLEINVFDNNHTMSSSVFHKITQIQ